MNKEFEESFKIGKIGKEQEEKLRKLIGKYREICAISNTKLGKTNIVKHNINTGNHLPIKQQP